MRIVIVAEVYLPKIDGVVIRTMNLIKRLLEQGDEVLVVCPEAEDREGSPVPVAEFRSFPFPAYPEYRIGIPDDRLIDVIKEFQPDVLHFLNPFAFGFRCHDVVNKANLGVPSVFSFHTLYGEFVKNYPFMKPLSPVLWWLMKDYHNRADVNLTVSSIMKDDLTERGFDRVELWPPAVNSQLFAPSRATAAMRDRLSAGNPEDPLLLTVSRLAPEKNVAFLADVMKKVPRARLAIVGDGPQRAELEERFRGTKTNFVGYCKGEELAEAYASADAFLYASETETLGNVILEAMASGLGIVAPRAGGIPSLVDHEQTGLLFDPKDLGGAVYQLKRLISSDSFRAQLGENACRQVGTWSWENAADRVREHYRQVADEAKSSESVATQHSKLAPLAIGALVTAFRIMSWPKHASPSEQPLAANPASNQ